ncbi:hypothetical protein BKA65DRAFT_544351 [Rhexocercosporidium sp. MPI-PUGE-AT-0058]|nr:hypothetical protein BKA65DRAFT_544351 [Rhexocercosporidium sp. MPI-PUGE-AT-0058]
MPGTWKDSDEETLIGDGPSNKLAVPSGLRTGDLAIWTPLPQDEAEGEVEEPYLPIVVARSKRLIPKEVIVCQERLRWPKSTMIDDNGRQQKELAMMRLALLAKQESAKTLTEFHLFPKIPIELRMKVYSLASRQPRIVALEFRHDLRDAAVLSANPKYLDRVHRAIRVCPASRVPALMQVHRESRQDCMVLYKKEIVSNSGSRNGDYIYVNPRVDVLHIGGDNMCVHAIREMLLKSNTGGHILPRVSIDISSTEALCCINENLATGNLRSVETLYGLHRAWVKSVEVGSVYYRFDGLQEITFVVGSRITHLQPKHISTDTKFRPALTNGVTFDDRMLKRELDILIKRIGDGWPMGVAGDTWIGDKKPTFKFVSFAPPYEEKDGKVFEIMTAQAAAIFWLSFLPTPLNWYIKYFGFVRNLERRYRCKITMHKTHPGYDVRREIAIEGVKEDVEKCRKALEERLVDVQETPIEAWIKRHLRLTWWIAMLAAAFLWVRMAFSIMSFFDLLTPMLGWCVARYNAYLASPPCIEVECFG